MSTRAEANVCRSVERLRVVRRGLSRRRDARLASADQFTGGWQSRGYYGGHLTQRLSPQPGAVVIGVPAAHPPRPVE